MHYTILLSPKAYSKAAPISVLVSGYVSVGISWCWNILVSEYLGVGVCWC